MQPSRTCWLSGTVHNNRMSLDVASRDMVLTTIQKFFSLWRLGRSNLNSSPAPSDRRKICANRFTPKFGVRSVPRLRSAFQPD